MSSKDLKESDKREFVRLKTRFPIEFAIVRLQGDLPGLDWQQATTVNVGKEGMCIETYNLAEPTIKFFRDQNILLDVRMKVPPQDPFIKVVCDVVWYKKEGEESNPKFVTGLRFRSIKKDELDRILFHARLFQSFSVLCVVLCIMAFVSLIIMAVMHYLK
jgi:hypothetical protein